MPRLRLLQSSAKNAGRAAFPPIGLCLAPRRAPCPLPLLPAFVNPVSPRSPSRIACLSRLSWRLWRRVHNKYCRRLGREINALSPPLRLSATPLANAGGDSERQQHKVNSKQK